MDEQIDNDFNEDQRPLSTRLTEERPKAVYKIECPSLSRKRQYRITDGTGEELLIVSRNNSLVSVINLISFYNYVVVFAILGILSVLTRFWLLILIWIVIGMVLFVIARLAYFRIFSWTKLDGSPIGTIRMNVNGSKWTINGISVENNARLHFKLSLPTSSQSMVTNWGNAETHSDLFTIEAPMTELLDHPSSNSFVYAISKFYVFNSHDTLCVKVKWNLDTEKGEYWIESQETIPLFLTLTISLCLVDKFMDRYFFIPVPVKDQSGDFIPPFTD